MFYSNIPKFDYFGWVASYNCISRHIFDNDTTGSDYSIISDVHVAYASYICAEINVTSNPGTFVMSAFTFDSKGCTLTYQTPVSDMFNFHKRCPRMFKQMDPPSIPSQSEAIEI